MRYRQRRRMIFSRLRGSMSKFVKSISFCVNATLTVNTAGTVVHVHRRWVRYVQVLNRLEVVEESSPVEDVEWDEREREQESRDSVDLADAVHLSGGAWQRFHAVVAALTAGRSRPDTLGQGRPDAVTALPVPTLRRTGRRRRTGVVLTAAHGGRDAHQRALRLAVDILRRCECALDWFARGATVARRCRTLFYFLQCSLHAELQLKSR